MKRPILLTVLALAATTLTSSLAFTMEGMAADASGIIDMPMQTTRGKGKNPEQRRPVFGQLLEKHEAAINAGHPNLESAGTYDVDMEILLDWNHVIDMYMVKSNSTLRVIPDTGKEDIFLQSPGCSSCWSMHSTAWAPDDTNSIMKDPVVKDMDFFYMTHMYSAEITGRFWHTDVCINHNKTCATDFAVLSVNKAEPWYYAIGDGYFGLQPAMLKQMQKHGLFAEAVMGIHTHLWNSTEDPSAIRFGGYNQDLFQDGQKQIWLQTGNSSTWELFLDQVEFHGEKLYKNHRALVNPGFPFIAMPGWNYVSFKKHLEEVYSGEHALTCEHMDWCYFYTSCDKLVKKIPDLKFTFKTSDGGSQEFRVGAKSFLYDDYDYSKNLTMCHLGVIGNRYSDADNWILGQSFMENFYATYDASHSDKLRVGLSYDPTKAGFDGATQVPEAGSSGTGIVLVMVVISALALSVLAGVFLFRCWYKKRQQTKLEKAKERFDTVKTSDDEARPEEEPLASGDDDPNTFFKPQL